MKLRSLVGMLLLLTTFVACNAPVEKPGIDIISLSSTTGPIDGGSTMIITGSNFEYIEYVKFGENFCTDLVVFSTTKMTCTVPAHDIGSVQVTIQGLAKRTASTTYTYIVTLPVIGSFIPSYGGLAGGNTLTITGSGFLTGATITVGGTNCAGVVVSDPYHISCIVPAKAAGTYSVSVTNPDGHSTTSTSTYLYVVTPTVTSVSPSTTILAGGGTMTINGTGFLAGAEVRIGGTTCTSPVVVNPTQMTCVIPAKVAGNYSVAVTNTNTKTGSLSGAILYRPFPVINSVTPAVGVAGAVTPITLFGTGYLTGAAVTVNGVACTSVVVVSAIKITCTTPALAAGTYNVVITNSDGQGGTKTNGFTYRPPPTITSISPVAGALAGGGTLTLTGTGFVVGAIIKINGVSCTVSTFASATSALCTVPPQIAGTYDVTITNPDAQVGTLPGSYTYQAAPAVTSVAPLVGPVAGGTPITITGTGFINGATVSVDVTDCDNVVVVNSTTITCDTPAHAAGAVTITVTNPDLQTGSQTNAFTYTQIPVLEFELGVISPNPPDPDSFGTTIANVTHTYTIANTGTGTSSAITISISGADPTAFTLGTDNCSGFTLAPAAECTVQVTFMGATMPTATYNAVIDATAVSGGADTNVISGTVP